MKKFSVYIYVGGFELNGPHDFDTYNEAQAFLQSECEKQVERCQADGHNSDDLIYVEESFYANSRIKERGIK